MSVNFRDASGINPQALVAATSAETCGLLTAFAFAVADTHPNPAALADAFERAYLVHEEAVKDVPGRDGPALAYAHAAAAALADAIKARLIDRFGGNGI